jgi:hypothetical protein
VLLHPTTPHSFPSPAPQLNSLSLQALGAR